MNAQIKTSIFSQINITEDLCPLSDFRADTASYITKVRSDQRPLALTQHGKCTAVLLSAESYQAMIERISLLEDVVQSDADFIAGDVVDGDVFKKKVMARFKK